VDFLQAVFDHVPLMVAVWDSSGRLVHVNRALECTLGWTLRDYLEHEAFSACYPDPLRRQEVLASIATGYDGWRPFLVRTRWGHDLETRWAVHRLRDGMRLCIGEDVTRQNETEQRLREQAAVFDHARDAIIVCNSEDRIASWNRGAERLYGWAAVEVLGLHLGDVLDRPGTGSDRDRAAIDQELLERGEWSGELEQATRAGDPLVIECSLTLLRDAEGRPRGRLAINTDVTEKKRLERQLLAGQRLESVGRLAGGLAHELNNILTPLRLGIDFLLERPDDPSRLSLLRVLQASVQRGAKMAEQMHAFARGGVGDRRPLEPAALLADVEKMLRRSLPRSVVLEVSAAADLWPVTGDATQLSQVLLNLCINARDAMPQGGTLTVRAENREWTLGSGNWNGVHPEARPGRYVLVTVADTGCGMAPGILERAFDPFFTTREVGTGTGLGLSAVRGIVRGHGGFIEADSVAGVGTTFRVYLPAGQPAEGGPGEAAAVGSTELSAGRGQWILVVEDEPAIRELARRMLETFGYRVLAAANGQEGLELFREYRGQIRLALVDLLMPIMDGPATIHALRTLAPRLAVIATSGLDSPTPAGAADLILQGFLRKPYSARGLLEAIQKVLGTE
jgi:PAS domain S-box-containing protein